MRVLKITTAILALMAVCLTPNLSLAQSSSNSPYLIFRDDLAIHVLIFGNPNYTKGLKPLPSVEEDVKVVKDAFDHWRKNQGHRIYTHSAGTFATVNEFYGKVQKYLKGETSDHEFKSGDALIIYYSGHGFHFGGSLFMVPGAFNHKEDISAQQVPAKAVSLNRLAGWLSDQSPRPTFLQFIFDACRTPLENEGYSINGNAVPGIFAKSDLGLVKFGEGLIPPILNGFFVGGIAASPAGESASASATPGSPSMFSEHFAKTLKETPKNFEEHTTKSWHTLTLLNWVRISGTASPFPDPTPFFGNRSFWYSTPSDIWGEKIEKWKTILLKDDSSDKVNETIAMLGGTPWQPATAPAVQWLNDNYLKLKDIPPPAASSKIPTVLEKPAYLAAKKTGEYVGYLRNAFTVSFPRNIDGRTDDDTLSKFQLADAGVIFARNRRGVRSVVKNEILPNLTQENFTDISLEVLSLNDFFSTQRTTNGVVTFKDSLLQSERLALGRESFGDLNQVAGGLVITEPGDGQQRLPKIRYSGQPVETVMKASKSLKSVIMAAPTQVKTYVANLGRPLKPKDVSVSPIGYALESFSVDIHKEYPGHIDNQKIREVLKNRAGAINRVLIEVPKATFSKPSIEDTTQSAVDARNAALRKLSIETELRLLGIARGKTVYISVPSAQLNGKAAQVYLMGEKP